MDDFSNIPEAKKAEWLALVPTEPGGYTDQGGNIWMLSHTGHWYDTQGNTRPIHYNFVLGSNLNKFRLRKVTKIKDFD